MENNSYVSIVEKLRDDVTNLLNDLRERLVSLIRANESNVLDLRQELEEAIASFDKRLTLLEVSIFHVPADSPKVDEHGNPVVDSSAPKAHDKDGNAVEQHTAESEAEPNESQSATQAN